MKGTPTRIMKNSCTLQTIPRYSTPDNRFTMFSTYIISVLIIFGVFVGWIGVQHLARRFAARHPEFGPAREEGGSCGISCGCAGIKDCPYGKTPEPAGESD